MGFGVRLCLSLLLAFAMISSARNIITLPGNNDEMVLAMGTGRSLLVSINDYGEPSANRGHDPPSKTRGGGGGGRRG